MPDNSELDSPTTAVGDGEPFPDNSKLTALLTERNEQLDHAENFIRTLQAEYDSLCQKYSDYCFKGEYELNRYRHLLACLESQLEEKKEKIIGLVLELEHTENVLRTLQITFNRVCQERDFYHNKLGEISFLLEREILKNQINYDTLKSVVLERERLMKLVQKLTTYWKTYEKKYKKAKTLIQQYQDELNLRTENENILTNRFQVLQNHYQQKKTQNQELVLTINHKNQIIRDLENEITDFQNQLETNQQTIWENEDYLINSDEVLAHKNTQIAVLNKQIIQQTQIINQLTNQIRDLNEVIETQKEDIDELETLEEEKRNKVVNLTQTNQDLVKEFHCQTSKWKRKYKRMIQERDTYLIERNNLQNWKDNHSCPSPSVHTCSPCSLPHLPTPHTCPIVNNVNCSHTDYDNLKTKLTEKELIIQQQAKKIRELENKPPVVETKTQEKIKEVEIPVEKLVDNPNDKQEIVRLQRIIKELEEKLNQPVLVKTNLIKVPNKQSQEVWVLRGLLLACILTGLILLFSKKPPKRIKGK